MTPWTLIQRGLRFYWRTHLGVLLGAAVSTTVLVGALVIGDSVRWSLDRMAAARLGEVRLALESGDRYFRARPAGEDAAPGEDLASLLAADLGAPTAPALMMRGSAVTADASARINQVQVVAVDERFWRLGSQRQGLGSRVWGRAPGPYTPDPGPHTSEFPVPSSEFDVGGPAEEVVVLSARAAARLGVAPGDEIRLTVEKPSALPRDAPLGREKDLSTVLWPKVAAIASDRTFGRFSLRANQVPPYNAFVPLGWLQKHLDLEGRANVLLVGPTQAGDMTPEAADAALARHFALEDAALEVRAVPGRTLLEVRSSRIFLDPAVSEAVAGARPGAIGVLTYFVNELSVAGRTQWYSMVTAVGPLGPDGAGLAALRGESPRATVTGLPADVADDEAIISDWLAEDIGAKVGDTLTTSFFGLGPGNRLEVRTGPPGRHGPPAEERGGTGFQPVDHGQAARQEGRRGSPRRDAHATSGGGTTPQPFRIRAVTPITEPYWDRTLMPPFPGLAEHEDCADWDPGVPIDLSKVRAKAGGTPEENKDQAYWDKYRGTPKALIPLEMGRRMWGNRFGDLTAIRFPGSWATAASALAAGDEEREAAVSALRAAVRQRLTPRLAGFFFTAVREAAGRATGDAMDFGPLFLGLSVFLLAAAVVLMALLFVFGVEQRTEEVGTLLALGLRPRQVRRLLLGEGAALAAVGSALGLLGGVAYTRLMLRALETVWSGAVGGMALEFHAGVLRLGMGFGVGVAVAAGAIWLALVVHARRPARELLAGGSELGLTARPAGRTALVSLGVGAAAALAALAIVIVVGAGEVGSATGAFFGAGSLLLVSGLAFSHAFLVALARGGGRAGLTLRGLGVRSAARRRGRSLATVALLACGSFLVVAVGANRRDPLAGAGRRDSGTGGFALYGETALPVYRNLNDAEVRQDRGLRALDGEGVRVVPLRVREGDEASCLNLNRPQQPRLAGVAPEALASRGAFRFAQTIEPVGTGESAWALLAKRQPDGAVPAIADAATITWSLKTRIGQTATYADEKGRPFQVRFVGALAPSMLQGAVFISEKDFLERFPTEAGYRAFLVDVAGDAGKAAEALSRGLRREGLALVPATKRLAEFYAMQNTYISIYQLLGGLGLVIGSVGLGLVVLRNVLERRGELALLRAVGLRRGQLKALVLWEHWGLLGLGLGCGIVAALVAVVPTIGTSGSGVQVLSLLGTLAGILASGVVWTYLAAWAALRGPLLDALRNE